MKTLRPYQAAAQKSLFNYLFNRKGHPLVVAPVGAGKSLMIAEDIKKLHEMYPRLRIVVLTHVKELLVQNSEELAEQYPFCDFGFYCAGLKQKRLHNDVTFASIQSVHDKLSHFNRVPEIIIIDECHLISHRSQTQYRKFIDAVLHMNPNCRVIGYTGTPFRTDTGRLDEGENKLFDDVAYEIGMDFMIEEGYWAKPTCPKLATKMDTSGVKVVGGDYVAKQLEEAINRPEITDACLKEMIEHGEHRKRWLVFTAGVQHAHDVKDQLDWLGISCEVVTGETPEDVRKQILADHKAGKFRALINVAVLTTGYNDPNIDLLAFMRPTRSPVLYIQIIGRGVRPVYADGYDLSHAYGRLDAIAASTKPDCMILDFGGVVSELGPIDQVSIQKKYKGEKEGEKGEALMKICPSCGAECAAGQRYCYSCSYCFVQLSDRTSNQAIVSTDVEPEWYGVFDMVLSPHYKENSQTSLCVSYNTLQGVIKEWVCFQHHVYDQDDPKRYAWTKAVDWHEARLPDVKVPNKVEIAENLPYPTPTKILARKKGKFYEILDYEYGERKPEVEEDLDEMFDIPF